MAIEAILVDLDGTITDTEKIYQRFWLEAAEEMGYDFFTAEDGLSLRSAWGPYAREIMTEKFGDKLDYDKLHDLCAVKTNDYMRNNQIELKPYANEFLDAVSRLEIKVAVVSASKMETLKWKLDMVGLRDRFEILVSAHGTKRGKPYPEPYIYACEQIGVAPDNAIAIEDSPNGAESAIAAGCKTIMVPDMTEADEKLRSRLYGYGKDLKAVLEFIQ